MGVLAPFGTNGLARAEPISSQALSRHRRCVPAGGSSGWFGPTPLLSVARCVQGHGGEGEHDRKENDR